MPPGPGADPYGHVHGRGFSATEPGLYRVGFRFLDTSANGEGGRPLHQPSPRFFVNFQAGITLAGISDTAEGIQLTYATASDFTYVVEAGTRLDPPDWQPVTPIEPGNDHLITVTVPTTADAVRFFRLRRETQ